MTKLLKNTYTFIISNKTQSVAFKINLMICIKVDSIAEDNIVGTMYFITNTEIYKYKSIFYFPDY